MVTVGLAAYHPVYDKLTCKLTAYTAHIENKSVLLEYSTLFTIKRRGGGGGCRHANIFGGVTDVVHPRRRLDNE